MPLFWLSLLRNGKTTTNFCIRKQHLLTFQVNEKADHYKHNFFPIKDWQTPYIYHTLYWWSWGLRLLNHIIWGIWGKVHSILGPGEWMSVDISPVNSSNSILILIHIYKPQSEFAGYTCTLSWPLSPLYCNCGVFFFENVTTVYVSTTAYCSCSCRPIPQMSFIYDRRENKVCSVLFCTHTMHFERPFAIYISNYFQFRLNMFPMVTLMLEIILFLKNACQRKFLLKNMPLQTENLWLIIF